MFTEKQRQQRVLAGKASYRKLILRHLEAATNPDGTINIDLAAKKITGARRALPGFRFSRGLTSTCVIEYCEKLDVPWNTPRPVAVAESEGLPF